MIRLLYHFQVLAVGMLPVMAILVSRIKMNGWEWLLGTELLMVGALGLYILFGQVDQQLIIFYGCFAMAFLFLITMRLGHHQFNRALSTTMLLSYVLTEYWEIPIFMAGYLGVLGKEYLTWTNQLYLLVAIVLLFRVTRIELTSTVLLYFLIPVSLSALILLNFPQPLHAGGFWYVSRALTFVFLGSIILFEVKK